jgi:hypothetical protein
LQALSDEKLLPRDWFKKEKPGGIDESAMEMAQLRNANAPQGPDPDPQAPKDEPRRAWYDRISPQKRSVLFVWVLGFLSFLTFQTGSADVKPMYLN